YSFIREDAILTVKPALGHVDVRYDHDQSENIIPNGGFDSWATGSLMNWGFETNPGAIPFLDDYESLTGQPGFAVDLSNYGTASARFTYTGRLPIDSNLLFKRMTWGFNFLPLDGFPFVLPEDPQDPTNGMIVWDNHPLRVRVGYEAKYRDGNIQMLWLNTWGYWQPDQPTGGWVELVGVSWSGNPVAEFIGTPMAGDILQRS